MQLIIHGFALDCSFSNTVNDSLKDRVFVNSVDDVVVNFGRVFGTGI